jgi:gluconate 2-dehydrogenase gamma chain
VRHRTRPATALAEGAPLAPEAIDRREALRRAALLLGGALAAPAAATLLAAREAALAAPVGWAPRVLTPAQLEQAATIADRIIPTTDTPGARAAGVHRFIDVMLAEYYDGAERARFVAGLAEVDARARAAHGRSFVRCSAARQTALLARLDDETFGVDRAADASVVHAFFRRMKELTLLGYYTSRPGASVELRYEAVPGRFDGCVPLARIGRAWST